MSWKRLIIDVGDFDAEDIERSLFGAGALSVSIEGVGEEAILEPAPDTTPVWRDQRLSALFGATCDFAPVYAALRAALNTDDLPPHHEEPLPDQDWERAWLRDFHPICFGRRLWVCPAGKEPPDPDAVVVRLDPGLAFGTGTHPTTAACLEWLEGQRLGGLRVLDYGCGSGILAIAALRLGAARATGIDLDPQALLATRANAQRNDVSTSLAVTSPDRPAAARYDVIVANILARPLMALAPLITATAGPGCRLALAGILAEQADAVAACYSDGFVLEPPARREEWAILTGRRRDG